MEEEQQISLDEQLLEFALEAQKHPRQSKEHHEALSELIEGIRKSPKLYRPRLGQFPHNYQEIYDEAWQELCVCICEEIRNYNPRRAGVMTWVNNLMNRRCFSEAIRKVRGDNKNNLVPLDDGIIERLGAENLQFTSEMVRECLEEDAGNLFKNRHIEGHPKANFQKVAISRMDGKSWKEISAELGVPISSLSGFYQNCLKHFAPVIKSYVER